MNIHDNGTLYRQYGAEHRLDELAVHLNITVKLIRGKFVLEQDGPVPDATETHHLWSVRQRPDYASNLIRLSWLSHQYCEKHKTPGRVLCLLAKIKSGEFDHEEFHLSSGKHAIGWASELAQFDDPIVERCRVELAERLTALPAST